jgi:uncharacterized membrane protein
MTLHIVLSIVLFALVLAFMGVCGYRIAYALGGHWSRRHARFARFRSTSQALSVLAERYARGEIKAEEYAERKAFLEK